MGECFFVHEITGDTLSTLIYTYRYICPQKFSNGKLDKNWYIVGEFKGFKIVTDELQQYHYYTIRQSHILFLSLNETTVKIALKSADKDSEINFTIEFQCLQQSQAFYGMIYHNVKTSLAVSIILSSRFMILPNVGYKNEPKD